MKWWRRLTGLAPGWCDPRPEPNRAGRRGGAAAMLDRATYDTGGVLPTGPSYVRNTSGRPEPVIRRAP